MIQERVILDEDLLLARINKVAKGAVSKSTTAEAGQIPVSDGNGGVTWGAATTGTVGAIDPNNDGHVTLQFTEAEGD